MTTPVVNVYLVDFKISDGDELVTENDDGTYTILINSRISTLAQHKAYDHAMWHILNGDLEYYKRKEADVQQVEAVANGLPDKEKIITPEKIPTWLKSLRRKQSNTKKALSFYEEKRKIMVENGMSTDFDIIPEAPISFDKEIRRLHQS